MKCLMRKCISGMPGIYEPVVLLWPEGAAVNSCQPASVQIALNVCEECKRKARPIDFFDERMWRNIKIHFHAVQKSQPSFKTAKLTFMLAETFDNKGQNI